MSNDQKAPVYVRLTRDTLDAKVVQTAVERPAAGAVNVFIGTTRNTHAGKEVLRLEYEAQETLAVKAMERICAEALNKHSLEAAAIVHRLGTLEIGEASVVIAVSSGHRGESFDGCRFLIDTLKQTVPIWKKEYYADGSEPVWVGPDGKPVHI